MTFAPPTLVELAAWWKAQGGVNLGIVGDASHQAKGTSYHLGADDLAAGAYSRQTARDKAGLSNAASAIDLGRLGGSLGELRAFSVWLVDRARANAPGTSDLREIIYSPDGSRVLRWDRERGYQSAPRPGEADASHLTHTHVSWYRDAQRRDHVTAFRPYFDQEAADVRLTTVKGEDWRAGADVTMFAEPDPAAPVVTVLPAGAIVRTIAEAVGADKGSWRLTELAGKAAWFRYRNPAGAVGSMGPLVPGGDPATDAALVAYIERSPAPPVDCSPIQSQLDVANARIARALVDLGAP